MSVIDNSALFQLSYGLYVLTAKNANQDNGCIINTVTQVTASPNRISVAVNKQNYTHDLILENGVFNVSVLSENVSFDLLKRFGFQSGRDTNKFNGFSAAKRSDNGLLYITSGTNALLSAKVLTNIDLGTHSLFIGDITEAQRLCEDKSVTYQYYFDHIKPKPEKEKKKGFVCKICGYVYEGEALPPDFICPICKHGAQDFEPLQ